MARIELHEVSLSYKGGGGVSDISLEIGDGESVALLGPSGSGKTTLLNLIGGFLAPNSGTVKIGEDLVAGPKTWVPPEKRNLGMVFQQHAVWPHRNVARNVEYPLKRAKTPKDERENRVQQMLKLVGLHEYADRSPDTLSGGQQQRVSLARALVMQPSALLLDEPFASLDAALRDRLRVELKAIAARTGTTVVHVTHDRKEALGLADRVAVIGEGRLAQCDAPRELLTSPATPFVAGLISDASLIEVECRDGGRLVTRGGGEIPPDPLRGFDGSSEKGTVALLPHDVALENSEEDREKSREKAEVRASMFTGEAVEVHLTWHGESLRATVGPDISYSPGSLVEPHFRGGIFFPKFS